MCVLWWAAISTYIYYRHLPAGWLYNILWNFKKPVILLGWVLLKFLLNFLSNLEAPKPDECLANFFKLEKLKFKREVVNPNPEEFWTQVNKILQLDVQSFQIHMFNPDEATDAAWSNFEYCFQIEIFYF